MKIKNQKIMVTGGAGFIGSHIVDKLMELGNHTVVFDNLSRGELDNIHKWLGHPNFRFVKGDLLNRSEVENAIEGVDIVFHVAANPEVRTGVQNPDAHYTNNVQATYNLLEVMRKFNLKRIVFTSTSAVYGDAKVLPVTESYGPLKPISIYGATKLACEAIISSYCHTFDMMSTIYRFANIIGSRSRYGVIYDFIIKLKQNPKTLKIFGDGKQTKSYLLVEDCIDAFFAGLQQTEDQVEIFNIGSEDSVNVKTIADIVANEAHLRNVQYIFDGGVDGGRGWKGDIKVLYLSVERLRSLGWRPKHTSVESVTCAARALIKEV